MTRNGGISIVMAMAAVAALECFFHWLAGQPSCTPLRAVLLCEDAGGRRFFAGMIDTVVPAVVLGLANGWVASPRWSSAKMHVNVVLIAMFVVAMLPFYGALSGAGYLDSVWGLRPEKEWHLSGYVFPFFSALLPAFWGSTTTYLGRRRLELERQQRAKR